MKRIINTASRDKAESLRLALLILPAITLGVLAMVWSHTSPVLWGQQIAVWMLFSLFASPLRSAAGRVPVWVWIALPLSALTATLFHTEPGTIKRWLDLGIFSANAAMLFLPMLLSVLPRIRQPHLPILAAAAILCLQPDLSQLTALAAAALSLLWQQKEKRAWTIASLLLLLVFEVRCLLTPAVIEPVSYCEGILSTLGEMSWILLAMGCCALAAIPVFFASRFLQHGRVSLLCIAVYYTVSMLFSLSGTYPVPFMGFGLSPIVGYFLACICAPDGLSP